MKRQMESIREFSFPFFTGVDAIIGKHIVNEFRRHIHESYIVGIIEQGARNITHLEGSNQVSENEAFILNPCQVHSCSSISQQGHSYKILSISPETMQSMASQISEKHEKRPFFTRVHFKNNALSNMVIQLFDEIENPESDIQVESSLYSFLAYLIMSFSESPPLIYKNVGQSESVKRVCDYISKNFFENLSLKNLANVACLSPFHFQREFKKNIGITPREYLNDFRIRESKKMLLNSVDIAEIAIKIGFFDQSHFSRIFQKTVGIPPGKYSKINSIECANRTKSVDAKNRAAD